MELFPWKLWALLTQPRRWPHMLNMKFEGIDTSSGILNAERKELRLGDAAVQQAFEACVKQCGRRRTLGWQ
jgi:hypothetical protein